PEPPRLVLTVVWDGGGWSGLETWPDAWPRLRALMDRGTSVTNAIAGSSPSVTPPIHASIGTGTFPKQHGIVDIPVRDGDEVVSSYEGRSPKYIAVPALADLYDAATANASKVVMFGYKTWHLGMIGHGAHLPGGDKDVAAIVEEDASIVTNPAYYSLPGYLADFPGLRQHVRAVDAADGRRDGRWLGGADLAEVESQRASPVWALRQTAMLKALVRREGLGDDDVPDLVFTNYKHIDAVGHDYGLLSPEMESIIRYSDAQLAELVRFLDREVGRGEWVLALTADHGPAPDLPSKQGFPIHMQRLRAHTAAHFGLAADELIQDERSTGFWLDRDVMAANGITPEDVADFLVGYTIDDNRDPAKELSDAFAERRDEPIFAAAFPGAAMGKVWHCVRKGAG
ncbi:MAG TPA: alkaline phosphatase family protein, partial [Actinomycetota bacterium]|nr:alkaline phosphatase family protein [Actinomycetota bacterium]